jgi:hypothetical protein
MERRFNASTSDEVRYIAELDDRIIGRKQHLNRPRRPTDHGLTRYSGGRAWR